MKVDDLVERYARVRAEAVEGKPWEQLSEAYRNGHLSSARVEIRYFAASLEGSGFALLPDALPEDIAEQVGLDCPLKLGDERAALSANGVQLFWAAGVKLLKEDLEASTPRKATSGD